MMNGTKKNDSECPIAFIGGPDEHLVGQERDEDAGNGGGYQVNRKYASLQVRKKGDQQRRNRHTAQCHE